MSAEFADAEIKQMFYAMKGEATALFTLFQEIQDKSNSGF